MMRKFLLFFMAAALAVSALASCKQEEDSGPSEAERRAKEEKAKLDQAKKDIFAKLQGNYERYEGDKGLYGTITIESIKIGSSYITLNKNIRIDLVIPDDILSYDEAAKKTQMPLVGYTDREIAYGFAVELKPYGWFYIYDSTVLSHDLQVKKYCDSNHNYYNDYDKVSDSGTEDPDDPSPALGFAVEGEWRDTSNKATLSLASDGAFTVKKATGAMTYSDCSYSVSGSNVTFRMKVTSKTGSTTTVIEIEDTFKATSTDSGSSMRLDLVKSKAKTTVGSGSPVETEGANASQMLLSVWNLPSATTITLSKAG